MKACLLALRIIGVRDRWRLAMLLLVTVAAAFLELAMVGSVVPFLSAAIQPGHPLPGGLLGEGLERVGLRSGADTLLALGGLALAAIVAAGAATVLRTYLIFAFSIRAGLAISGRLLAAQLRQPYAYFLNRHSGELANLVTSESGQVIDQFLMPVCLTVTSLLTVAALVGLLLWVSPAITGGSMLLLGGLYGATYWLSRRVVSHQARERMRASSERGRTVVEAFGGIKTVKLTGSEPLFSSRHDAAAGRVAHAVVLASVIAEVPKAVVQTVGFAGIILLCLLFLTAGEDGHGLFRAVPTLGLFAFAGQRLLPALGNLYGGASRLRYGREIVQRVSRELEQAEAHPPVPEGPVERLPLTRSLRLRDVSFLYPGSDGAGLRGVSLEIGRGERIGIVGASGAGKTTLADIVLGLLRPSSGGIEVDGTELTDALVRPWQRSVGYVPQDIFLSDGTVVENIAFGVAPARIDRDRAIRCAVTAQLDAFVRASLPAGYETRVGERGVRLSGGQRQRLGIARALYAEADLLLLDEATSALDGVTEEEVMGALAALPGDKTLILVAHRLSTLRVCDRIVVMEQGQVRAVGRWDELARTSPVFRRMADKAGLLHGT